MNALHEQFIAEARELIREATNDLIALEREESAPERIDRIFRAFHTLKGSAGVVELPSMTLTMHAAEDLLAAIHGGRVAVSTPIIDRALACLDQVSRWVDIFEAHETLPLEAGEQAQVMARSLRNLLSKSAGPASAGPDGVVSDPPGDHSVPEWVTNLIDAGRERISRHLQERPSAALVAAAYEPRPGCFFDGDDPLALMRAIPDLLVIRVEPREAWPPVADLDPYACNLRLAAISAGNRAELANIFRLVPDQVQLIDVPIETLPSAAAATVNGETVDLVRTIVAEQRRLLTAAKQNDDLAGRVGSIVRVASNALRYIQCPHVAKPIEMAGATAIADADVAALLAAIDGAVAALTSSPRASEAADVATAALEPQSEESQSEESQSEAARPSTSRLLRVNEDRIDALLNLASELIVAKNGLAHLARRIDDEFGSHDLARAAQREKEAVDRLASEIHDAILQLRLVSVEQVFRSFPRLLRDISQRLGKKAALVTRGETAEADKTVVDRIFEPLLHLVRNALDHGIENAAERRAAGKPEIATVMLQAARVGDRFIVEVRDDGRGIDPDAIKRKALEWNILTADDLVALSDEQALNLVFSAGLSTAKEVSDISGRGVGMDVVRNTVEQLGGRVSLTSSLGFGTTVRLDLPMNIAITRIMAVEAGGQVFGIPMDAVTETVRVTPDRISQIKGNEGFVLRDRVVPICSLAEMMNLPMPLKSERHARLMLVIEVGGKIAAIEVEAIRDRFEVVLKPMQGLLSGTRGYAGTTVTGDGTVLLVLDTRELLP